MCDIYTGHCEGCSCDMEMHIGDFSVERDTIHPYCPRCTKKVAKENKHIRLFMRSTEKSGRGLVQMLSNAEIPQKWYSYILERRSDTPVTGGKKGQTGFIRCEDIHAVGVSVNDS